MSTVKEYLLKAKICDEMGNYVESEMLASKVIYLGIKDPLKY